MNAPSRSRRARRIRPEQLRSEIALRGMPLNLVDLARLMVDHVRRRQEFLPDAVFGDPQWLMTLVLFIAADEDRAVPVTSLCFASGVPPTTALRHIRSLEAKRIFERASHPSDKRIIHMRLSGSARANVERYLRSINSYELVKDDPPLRAAH